MSEENPPAAPLEQSKKPFGWSFWLLLGCGLTILWAAEPRLTGGGRNPFQTEATSNARQIGLALFEFETEYGTFPSEETAKEVAGNDPKSKLDLSGKSSNAIFRQLIAANITHTEAMFYAKGKGVRKPDGDISTGKALEAGEVGFGIVAGLSATGDPARPSLFCPIIPGTSRFDPEPFKGNAVIVRIDGSVGTYKIDGNGHAIFKGKNILSPDHAVWKGEAPDIRYPE